MAVNLTEAGSRRVVRSLPTRVGLLTNGAVDVGAEVLIARGRRWRTATARRDNSRSWPKQQCELSQARGEILGVPTLGARHDQTLLGREGKHREPSPKSGFRDKRLAAARSPNCARDELTVSDARINAMVAQSVAKPRSDTRDGRGDKLARQQNRPLPQTAAQIEPLRNKANIGYRRFTRRRIHRGQSEWR